MKAADAGLLAAEHRNQRYPISKAYVYPAIPVWTQLTDAFAALGFPSSASNGEPQALTDAAVDGGNVAAAWYRSDGYVSLVEVSNLSAWSADAVTNYDADHVSRPSVIFDKWHNPLVYYRHNNHLYCNGFAMDLDPLEPNAEYAFATVAGYGTFTARLLNGYLNLRLIDGALDEWDSGYTFEVDDGYGMAALSWFDAIELESGSVAVVFNRHSDGNPHVILYTNGVWGDPHPLWPMDIVDNYSNMHVGWLVSANDIVYATGEIMRRGSTGLHAQSAAVLVRTRDAQHWTFDRYTYLASTTRSPLVIADDTLYRIESNVIYSAPYTRAIGYVPVDADDGAVAVLRDEIVDWSRSEPNKNSLGTLQMNVSNFALQFSSGASEIKEGYQLDLYAGYYDVSGEHWLKLSTYGIDRVNRSLGPATSGLNLQCSEIALRRLNETVFSQDWQWITQVKSYNDGLTAGKLYGLTSGYATLVDDDAGVGHLIFDDYNELCLMATTERPQYADHTIRAGFHLTDSFVRTSDYTTKALGTRVLGNREDAYIEHSYLDEISTAEANAYTYDATLLGTGFGVFLAGHDEYNFYAVFVDLANQKVYLLQRTGTDFALGTEDDNLWLVLAERDPTEELQVDKLYNVEADVAGGLLYYHVFYAPDTPADYVNLVEDYYTGGIVNQGDLTGIIANIRVPESQSAAVERDSSVIARDWDMWDATKGACGSYNMCPSDRFFEFDLNRPFYLGEEQLKLVNFTKSQHASFARPVHDAQVDSGTLTYYGEVWDVGTDFYRGILWYDYWNAAAPDLRPHLGWLYTLINGRGSGSTSRVLTFNYDEFSTPPVEEVTLPFEVFARANSDQSQFSFIALTEHEASQLETDNEPSEYALLPGFLAYAIDGEGSYVPRSQHPGDFHPSGTRILSHYNEQIAVDYVTLVDHERPVTIDWALKDIAAKAGILSFQGSLASDDTELIEDFALVGADFGSGDSYIDRPYNDFVLDVAMSGASPTSQLMLYIHRTDFSEIESTIDDVAGVLYLAIMASSSSDYEGLVAQVDVYQYTSTNTILLYRTTRRLTSNADAEPQNVVLAKSGPFISVWVEDRLVSSYRFYEHDGDSYNEGLDRPAWLEMWCDEDARVTMHELYHEVEGVIADQGSTALAATAKVIRDARIRLLAASDGSLKMSLFETRPDAGTLADVAFLRQTTATDALPTYVRAVGEEISEYIDHAAAAQYGLIFSISRLESLGENDAYLEAQHTVEDYLSYNGGATDQIGAQLELEPEDEIAVDITTYEGETIDASYIIDNITMTFGVGSLESQLRLRRKVS